MKASVMERKGLLWRTLIAVLWSFFGVRKSSEYEEDIKKLNPLHLIVVGIGACFLFVVGLMFFVQWVVVALR
jgi:amino acid transporter